MAEAPLEARSRDFVGRLMGERQRLARECADLRDECSDLRDELNETRGEATRYRNAVDLLINEYNLPDDAYEHAVYGR